MPHSVDTYIEHVTEKKHVDAIAVQLGVAYGLSGGTAIGLLVNNLPYWMTLGCIIGVSIAYAKNAENQEQSQSN